MCVCDICTFVFLFIYLFIHFLYICSGIYSFTYSLIHLFNLFIKIKKQLEWWCQPSSNVKLRKQMSFFLLLGEL